ncbi:MAG: hypothetical protein E7164_00970 [Firmicutes bacterium]|nr:hypothetical protein [Bacillota bacterium]
MNQYLIPANSKKSKLILGFFTLTDLIVCGIGGGLTVLLLIILQDPTTLELIIAILPLLFAALMVFPIAHYHNVMQLLSNIISFAFGRKKYYWKGWCVKDDTNE